MDCKTPWQGKRLRVVANALFAAALTLARCAMESASTAGISPASALSTRADKTTAAALRALALRAGQQRQ